MIALDRTSPMPLWAQLEASLQRRLERGEFDDRFPTDGELVEQYGVSRHTVREAIRHLNKTGILRRERGRGTVVNHGEFVQPLGALYSLFQSIESSGVEQRNDVLKLEETRDDDVAAQLGLELDAPLLFIERLRYADNEPLALDQAWLPMAIAGALTSSQLEHAALYDEMERLCGVRPNAGWERIAPILPTPAVRSLLNVRRGEASPLRPTRR